MDRYLEDRRLLGSLLKVAYKAMAERVERELIAAGCDVRESHFPVFQNLEPDGSRVTELAERARMSKQAMQYLVDHLEARGYLERVPDPRDGRAKMVQLTEAGWALDRRVKGIAGAIEAEWATRLGETPMAQLRHLLLQLAEAIGRPEQTSPRLPEIAPPPNT
jgi:DNA-binding MarR family transcriptional regulator